MRRWLNKIADIHINTQIIRQTKLYICLQIQNSLESD